MWGKKRRLGAEFKMVGRRMAVEVAMVCNPLSWESRRCYLVSVPGCVEGSPEL